MTPVLVLLISALLHVLAFAILIKHRRNVRHHRASTPVIGSSPKLTEAFHQRLKANAPLSDWLHPANLRAKCAAWLNRNNTTSTN